MEGGKEQNYWPGFVDALSNVVLTLVFVLVIFVFALLMASNKVEKKMQEVVAAEKAQKAGQAQLDRALAELADARSESSTDKNKASGAALQQSMAQFNKSDSDQKSDITANSITIFFGSNAISVTDDTTKVIHNLVDTYKAQNGGDGAKLIIESPENPDATSPLAARELQLGRMLNVRNSLLSGKVPAANISVHYVPPLKQNDSYDWVRVYVQK